MKLKSNIDKLGTIGLFITALFSPCCFLILHSGHRHFGLEVLNCLGDGQCGYFNNGNGSNTI